MFTSPLVTEIQHENANHAALIRGIRNTIFALPATESVIARALRLQARQHVGMIRHNRDRIGGFVTRAYAA